MTKDVYLDLSVNGLWETDVDADELLAADSIETELRMALKHEFEHPDEESALDYDVNVKIEEHDND